MRLFTLIFGAAAFENSALLWACEHRAHHKHVDHEDDPYNIREGLFQAHIGWLLFKLKPPPPFDNVSDLQKDPLVMWQHQLHSLDWRDRRLRRCRQRSVMRGVAGRRRSAPSSSPAWPVWSSSSTAPSASTRSATTSANSPIPRGAARATRGSWPSSPSAKATTIITTSFQHDYRNGVKPWQFDPTKWIIWTLSKIGLAKKLRRVPAGTILRAELAASSDRYNANNLASASQGYGD